MGRAVSNGKINFLSASAISKGDPEQFGGCPRRWWYRYIKGIKEPMGKAAFIGNKMHNEIEHYLKTGEDTLGDIARRAKQFILKPGSDLIVEHKMTADELTIAGINMTGKIDVVHARDYYIKPTGGHGALDGIEIIDWKSTSSLERVKPPDSKQCIAYGEWACRHLGVDGARVSLVFVPTRKREPAVKTTRLYTRQQLQDEWARAIPIVETLKLAAKETNPDNVPANKGACEAFPPHGCPHQQYCSAGQKKTLEQVLGKAGSMSVLDQVLVNKEKDALVADEAKAKGVDPKALAAWATIQAADYGTPAVTKEALATVASTMSLASVPLALAGSGMLGGHTVSTNKELIEIANDITERAAAGTPVPTTTPIVALTPPETPASDPVAAAAAAEPPAPPPAAELPPEVPPAGMTRPEKRMKKGELLELAELYYEDAVKMRKLGDGDAPSATVTPGGLELYANCAPGVGAMPLEPYVDELIKSLITPYDINGIRSAPNDSPLGYDGWKDALAALAAECPPDDGVYIVDTRNELSAIVFRALQPKCARWARG